MINVKVKSVVTGSETKEEFNLEFIEHAVSAREIIERSVQEQFRLRRNSDQKKSATVQVPDIEKETYIALTAFQRHEYFLFVDQYQMTSLNEVIRLTERSVVKFLRVTPLVGG